MFITRFLIFFIFFGFILSHHVSALRSESISDYSRKIFSILEKIIYKSESKSVPHFKNKKILLEKIEKYIHQKKSLQFGLVGFPFKCPNLEKCVLGKAPDLGEREALLCLERIAKDIQKIYPRVYTFY